MDDFDLTNLILDFGTTASHGFTDTNGDGIVDDFDLTNIILNFGGSGDN